MREDVDEFAALLRGLKDRTDRSYGSLARRLHMNTSTLHRYCAGEAVPQEFAPVERLAAFCEATPQERLELHRLWLAAVAARQRTRTAGAPGATDGADPTHQAVAADLADPPDPTLQAAAADESPIEESSPAAPPGDAPDPSAPVLSPAPLPWYRRRRALASTAAACALLAALGVASALSDGRAPEADASLSAGPRPTASGATPRPQHSRAATPAPSRSPASSDVRANASAPTAPVSDPVSDPGSAATPTARAPLTWSADSQVWDGGCRHDYVIDKPFAQVPPPPVQQDAGAWAATQGAVHGQQTMVRISVQGRSSTAVVLEALRVRVVSRGNPAAGIAYAMDHGCGGELRPRRFTVNLDVDRPIARPADGADNQHTLPAVHFPLRVSAEDPEVLLVDATTQTHDARWYLELDWSSQGRTGTIRIDAQGRPFHTTGIVGKPRYWYGTNAAGERAWVPYNG